MSQDNILGRTIIGESHNALSKIAKNVQRLYSINNIHALLVLARSYIYNGSDFNNEQARWYCTTANKGRTHIRSKLQNGPVTGKPWDQSLSKSPASATKRNKGMFLIRGREPWSEQSTVKCSRFSTQLTNQTFARGMPPFLDGLTHSAHQSNVRPRGLRNLRRSLCHTSWGHACIPCTTYCTQNTKNRETDGWLGLGPTYSTSTVSLFLRLRYHKYFGP
jgi:hypothetical protein